MLFENIGLTVTAIGGILGVLLIIFGGSVYLLEKNGVKSVTSARTLGIGIIAVMVSISFSIPNQLLAQSTSTEISMLGVIIISVFLGSPLIFMGLASYIGLNSKAHQMLNAAAEQEEVRHLYLVQKELP